VESRRKYLVFCARGGQRPEPARWKDGYIRKRSAEVPIQYDLYRIPFNGGQGGTPEPIAGASQME